MEGQDLDVKAKTDINRMADLKFQLMLELLNPNHPLRPFPDYLKLS